MDFRKIGIRLLKLVGGKDNVSSVQNCMTRLRFVLKDESICDDEQIRKTEGVKGVVHSGGQVQIIIGKGVEELCAEVRSLAGISGLEKNQQAQVPEMKWHERLLDILSGTMIPLIGVTIGGGMVLALMALLSSVGILSAESGTYQFFYAVGNSSLYFLPVFAGYTAAQKMNANPFMGMLLGATLLSPDLMGLIAAEEGLQLFGITLSTFTYGSTVIPIILAVWFMSHVEKLAKKICPKVISSFGVPTIVILITVPITYLVIGPLGALLTNGISSGVLFLSEHVPFLGITVAAALLPILVMSGLHMSLIPVMITIITAVGYDPIIAPAFMVYNIAASGTAFAFGLKAKGSERKQLGMSCTISAILGVTEPTLFGIMVTEKKPLITTICACGITGVLAGFIGYGAYVPMSQSLFSIPAAINGGVGNLVRCVVLIVVSFGISFAATWLFGVDNSKYDEKPEEDRGTAHKNADALYAYVSGKVIPIENVQDEVFSRKTLGDGLAIEPESDVLVAPADGEISLVMEGSNHACGLVLNNGAELLLHIGIDTVGMNGDGFVPFVKAGDRVKKGDKLIGFDRKKIEEAGYPATVVMVVTEGGEEHPIQFHSGISVRAGDEIALF